MMMTYDDHLTYASSVLGSSEMPKMIPCDPDGPSLDCIWAWYIHLEQRKQSESKRSSVGLLRKKCIV